MNTIKKTPIIHDTDYIILGGGLKDVIAAICLAMVHKRILLLTKETYLLEDLCNSNLVIAPFDNSFVNPILLELFPEDVYQQKKEDYEKWILHPDKLKRNVEKVCDRYGITMLYNVMPLDTITKNEQKYLRIGGKFGVCCVACKEIVNLNGNEFISVNNQYYINIMNLPSPVKEEKISVLGEAESYEITIFPGSYNESHGILQIPCEENKFYSKVEYHMACKQKGLEAFLWLKTNRNEYAQIVLGRFAADGFFDEYDYLNEINKGIRCANSIQEYRVTHDDRDVCCFWEVNEQSLQFPMVKTEMVACNLSIKDRNYKILSAPNLSMDNMGSYDVIIVGGGTSGVMAAIHASRNGLSTLLLEMNQEVGGSGTVGGVSTYWFGKRFHDVMEVDKEIQNIYDWLSIERNPGIWSSFDDCNPGIKSMVLLKLCKDAGVIIKYPVLVFGVLKEKDTGRIQGVTAVTKEGVACYYGKYVVDATGDGDIASFAGAEFVYGSKRDHITYWGSLAQYISPSKYCNNFSSTLMVPDPFDYTRFIRLGRCRGENTFDHGIYVSPRESRHIKGKYEINLKDIICFRTYEDGIYTCFSNYDPKGKLSADMVYAGVLPPQVSIQIPLRALLPIDSNGKSISGLIVAGKAISSTHNAFPSIRMQPDLMHQGSVIGRILAEAINTSTDLTKLNTDKLKNIIYAYTGDQLVLPILTMKMEEVVKTISYQDRRHWVDFPFTEEVEKEERSLRVMSADSRDAKKLLEKRYVDLMEEVKKKEDKKRVVCGTISLSEDLSNLVMLAGYLLWHGSDLGTDLLLQSLLKELNAVEGLPVRSDSTMCVQLLPDHGVMPEVVYQLNLLAWSKAKNIMEPFYLIIDRLKKMNLDFLDIKQGVYHYIEVFPYVAERTGNKEFIPLLLQLKELQEFKEVFQAEKKAELLTERLYILLLSIHRALARCGERKGYEGLIQMLSIESISIASSACRELEELTGEDYGLDRVKWNKILNTLKEPLRVCIIEEKLW